MSLDEKSTSEIKENSSKDIDAIRDINWVVKEARSFT